MNNIIIVILVITGASVWVLILMGFVLWFLFGGLPAVFRWISHASWQAWYEVEKKRKASPQQRRADP